MSIPQADQEAVWAVDSNLLSDNAKVVFQLMSDTDDSYGAGAADLISTQLGGSKSSEEVLEALHELWTKGYINAISFVPRYPPLVPGPIGGG
jgi:hypothetical protein